MLTTPNKHYRTTDGRRRGATDRSYRAGSYHKQVSFPHRNDPMRRGRVFATRAAVYDNKKRNLCFLKYIILSRDNDTSAFITVQLKLFSGECEGESTGGSAGLAIPTMDVGTLEVSIYVVAVNLALGNGTQSNGGGGIGYDGLGFVLS